ncbi:MAG TPA: sigma factor [Dongiaceae bacterium]|nr:sigma factor [Dongiaceae bacterium]
MNWLALFALHSQTPHERTGEAALDQSLEHPVVFVERFWKWRDSLYVVSLRMLREPQTATDVVEACFRRACAKPPKFESDGAFGSWLLRILIDEALRARGEKRRAGKAKRQQSFPNLSETIAAKLEFTDEFWCLDTAV